MPWYVGIPIVIVAMAISTPIGFAALVFVTLLNLRKEMNNNDRQW